VRALARGGALILGALFALVLLAQPAGAHAVLVRVEPASGATLGKAPDSVSLWFNEDISAQVRSARLVDGTGRAVTGAELAPARSASRVVKLNLPALPAGSYGVVWRVLAEGDGHPASGVVVFHVGAATSAGTITSADAVTVPAPPDVALRWLRLCLLAGLIGGLTFAGLVLGRARDEGSSVAAAIRKAQRRVLAFAAACAALGSALGVVEAIAKSRQLDTTLGHLLADTRWGHLWLAREAIQLALACAVPLVHRHTFPRDHAVSVSYPQVRRIAGVVAATLVLVLAWLEALGSHAAALDSARGFAVLADSLHVLAACVWLGALPALLLTLWPRDGVARQAVVRACRGPFTRLVATSVGVIVVSGLYSAGRQVDTVEALFTTAYGRTLFVKGALVFAIGGLGLVNSTRLHERRYAWLPSRRPARPLSRRVVAAEAAVGVLLLVAVGVHMETAPARGLGATPPAAVPADALTRGGSVADLVVAVSATPNRQGVNAFTVTAASSRRPAPAPIDDVALELAGSGSLVRLQQIEPGRYFGTGQIDASGPTRITVVLHRAGRSLTVAVPWEIAPAPAPVTRPAAGHGLALYANALALWLLAVALLVGAGRLAARRRRDVVDAMTPAQVADEVLEVQR